MSTEIEFCRISLALPPAPNASYPCSEYMVLVERGSNNCTEFHNGRERIGRSWQVIGVGELWSPLMHVICRNACYTEGGMLRFANSQPSPESYIARYRKLVEKESVPLEGRALRAVGVYDLTVRVPVALPPTETDWDTQYRATLLGRLAGGLWVDAGELYGTRVYRAPIPADADTLAALVREWAAFESSVLPGVTLGV